jgi:hypothetical protein
LKIGKTDGALFLTNSKFKILDVDDLGNDVYEILLKEID